MRYWILILGLLLSGCGVVGGGAIREYDSRINEITEMITQVNEFLAGDITDQERAAATDELQTLQIKLAALTKKKDVAEKATETAGSGIAGLLGILGVLLGVPTLGSMAGSVAKKVITS